MIAQAVERKPTSKRPVCGLEEGQNPIWPRDVGQEVVGRDEERQRLELCHIKCGPEEAEEGPWSIRESRQAEPGEAHRDRRLESGESPPRAETDGV